MKTVDEMADELCRILNDYGPNAAVFPMPCYQRLAQHVLDLIAQAKSERSPGDSMTDEEVAKELADAFASAYPGALTWHELTGNQKQGNIAEARRARELFRPGSKAPEGKPRSDSLLAELEEAEDRLRKSQELHAWSQGAARKLARHVRDLLAAARVQENLPEIEELVEEWADVDDPADPEDRDGV